jgi:hypothetical protein
MKAAEAIKDFMTRAKTYTILGVHDSHGAQFDKDFNAGCQRHLYQEGSTRATWVVRGQAKPSRGILQCDGNLGQDLGGREQGRRCPH